jgi:tRNA-specific 2-thiouridylase
MAKVLVGLSGGVDSAVAAALMVEQGHEVAAGYMKNWINDEGIPGDCPWEQDIEDARAVAKTLGIEFRVIDLIDAYRDRIVEYLVEGYRAGITPNPDVWCNREMKFGVFLDYALSQGFEQVATGHYARRRNLSDGSAAILRGADPNKDQSYFLSLMTQRQAAHALFPTGEMLKPAVREVAKRFHLPVAEKKDSQGICFLGQVKMTDFLRHYVPDSPGKIVDVSGKVLGEHHGLHLYTLGQRKGHGVASPGHGVCGRREKPCEKPIDRRLGHAGLRRALRAGMCGRHAVGYQRAIRHETSDRSATALPCEGRAGGDGAAGGRQAAPRFSTPATRDRSGANLRVLRRRTLVRRWGV